eukprot:m.35189 g.35189  ORF g.35189 m.35189 type:complete len:304 (-) comp9860_c0_seq2:336-1247(-)
MAFGLVEKVSQVSLATKGVLVGLVLLHALSWIEPVYNGLAITPGKTFPPQMHIWTLITGPLMESSVVFLLVDLVALFAAAGIIEPIWGPYKLVEFVGVAGIASGGSTAFIYILKFIVARDLNLLFFPFSGFTGVLLGLTVAYKQSFPVQTLLDLGAVKLTAKDLPLLCIGVVCVLYAIGLAVLPQVYLALSGFLWSWVFLRFHQRRDGSRGCPSEDFTFEDFFPPAIQPVVHVVGKVTFRTLQALKVCKKPQRSVLKVVSGETAAAVRHRQLAEKALNDRLEAVTVQVPEDATGQPTSSSAHQ